MEIKFEPRVKPTWSLPLSEILMENPISVCALTLAHLFGLVVLLLVADGGWVKIGGQTKRSALGW